MGRPVTLWSRVLKKDGVEYAEFNHIEDGHHLGDSPTPKHEIHKRVWGGKWTKEHALLSDTIPPVVIHTQAS